MRLKELFLTKEEVPVDDRAVVVHIPIHPKLVDPNKNIDRDIALKVLPRVAADFRGDIKRYLELPDAHEWIRRAYTKPPRLIRMGLNYVLDGVAVFDYHCNPNGLVNTFSIDDGSTIYFSTEESYGGEYLDSPKARGSRLSPRKVSEFSVKRTPSGHLLYFYNQHNIETYPQALILRNWAIHYMNRVFKEVFPNGT